MLASYWFLEELSRLGLDFFFGIKEDHPILGLVNIFKKSKLTSFGFGSNLVINNSKFDRSNFH
jgi:hypothetical protein